MMTDIKAGPRMRLAGAMLALLAGCAQQPPGLGERFRSGEALAPMPLREGLEDRPARRLRGDAPITPVSAALHGTPGFVCLGMTVDVSGRVRDIEVLKATAPIFGAHAAHALKEWVFEPALHDGKPVSSTYRQFFWFNQDGNEADARECMAIRSPTPAASKETPASPRTTGSAARG